eukprot:TRINITY_DN1109_c0_g1_i1.p1 TRINITY_DN1109_c0_g1~~TRINITY_DN1109_c0_g1_i1.p1  ORF type:complete len:790 (+),score=143.82 TRINITY_DN1109_c0_g1_i1:258-2627(+)
MNIMQEKSDDTTTTTPVATSSLKLWELINNDYDELAKFASTYYPALRARLAAESAASWAEIEASLTLQASKTVSKEERVKLIAKKTAELERAKYALRDLSFDMSVVINRTRENLMTYVVAELAREEFENILKRNMYPEAVAAYKMLATDAKAPNSKVFPTFTQHQNGIDNSAGFVGLIKFIHSTETQQLPGLLFEKTKGIPAKDISSPSLPNWPGIKNCMETAYNLREKIHQVSLVPAGKRIFGDSELRYYSRKLSFVMPVVFNSLGAKHSKEQQDTPDIDFDLAPFQPVPESLLKAFFSPTQYVMNAFRNAILKYTPYEIVPVDGDGNCFFRAVVRSVYPKLSKSWENKLSLALRQSVNTGVERRLRTQGQADNYQFQGFVIADVNDSVTMAKAGVWADHVQVQKLSALFQCPIRLITFDDVGLKITQDGQLHPGPDYIINPHFKRDPITLFFTPSPGHYEALIFRQPQQQHSQQQQQQHSQQQSQHTTHNGSVESMSVTDLFMAIYNAQEHDVPVAAPVVCKLYLKLEEETQRLGSIMTSYNNIRNDDDMKRVMESDILEAKKKLTSDIINLTAVVGRLGKSYIASLQEHSDSILYQEIINPLVDDTLVFSGHECLNVGKGPLSTLYDAVQRCDPKQGQSFTSMIVSLSLSLSHTHTHTQHTQHTHNSLRGFRLAARQRQSRRKAFRTNTNSRHRPLATAAALSRNRRSSGAWQRRSETTIRQKWIFGEFSLPSFRPRTESQLRACALRRARCRLSLLPYSTSSSAAAAGNSYYSSGVNWSTARVRY